MIRAVMGLIVGAFFFVLMTYVFIHNAVVPLLLQSFGQETTAQVITCAPGRIKGGDGGHLPSLTYSYTWDGKTLTGVQSLDKTYDSTVCNRYLNQTMTIRVLVPNPSESRLIDPQVDVNPGSVIMSLVFMFASLGVIYNSLMALLRRSAR